MAAVEKDSGFLDWRVGEVYECEISRASFNRKDPICFLDRDVSVYINPLHDNPEYMKRFMSLHAGEKVRVRIRGANGFTVGKLHYQAILDLDCVSAPEMAGLEELAVAREIYLRSVVNPNFRAHYLNLDDELQRRFGNTFTSVHPVVSEKIAEEVYQIEHKWHEKKPSNPILVFPGPLRMR